MQRFVLFLMFGGLAACVNWLSRFAYQTIVPFSIAVLVAYLSGMVLAFVLFRTFVFPGSPRPMHEQVISFCLVNLLGLTQTWLLAMLLVGWVLPVLGLGGAHMQALGHALAIVAPVGTSWIAHRRLTFAGARTPSRRA